MDLRLINSPSTSEPTTASEGSDSSSDNGSCASTPSAGKGAGDPAGMLAGLESRSLIDRRSQNELLKSQSTIPHIANLQCKSAAPDRAMADDTAASLARAAPSPSSGRKKRVAHTKEAIGILKEWLMSEEHVHNPYPTEAEKKQLMACTGLDKKQLTNWFTNARKRIWQPKYGPTPKSKKGEAADATAAAAAAAAARLGACGDGADAAIDVGAAQPLVPPSPPLLPAAAVQAMGTGKSPARQRVKSSPRTRADIGARLALSDSTPQQRKREHPPSFEPMQLSPRAPPDSGSMAANGIVALLPCMAAPRVPKTPRLECADKGASAGVVASARAGCAHEVGVAGAPRETSNIPAEPELEPFALGLGNGYDAHLDSVIPSAGDVLMMHSLSPVQGLEDTLGSPVESAWLESSVHGQC